MSQTVTTMDGFRRSSPAGPPPDPVSGSEGWCVRDSYCQLLGWPRGSPEWHRFVEYPNPDDMLPLARHLGVTVFDVGIPEHWNKLIDELDHPGIATFELPGTGMGHAVYVHHVRALLHHWPTFGGFPRADLLSFGWPLGSEHMRYSPRLFWVIVDERQPPQPM
jgi:hypothetical protein